MYGQVVAGLSPPSALGRLQSVQVVLGVANDPRGWKEPHALGGELSFERLR
jgi:hypothetical protein